MRFVSISAAMIATAAIAGCAQPSAPPPAPAPALPPLAANTQFFGAGVSAAPGCPKIQWNMAPTGDMPGHYHGIAYFADLSGIGYVDGMIGGDGKISGTVKSVYQKGPDGTLTGLRNDNGIQVQLAGAGCSNVTIVLPSRFPDTDQGSRG